MFFQQYGASQPKIPLRLKISLILGIILGLTFLAIFTFSFFLVALASGLILFILRLFRRPSNHIYNNSNPSIRQYRHPLRDDDIIDI